MKNFKIILFVAAFCTTNIGSIAFAQSIGPDCSSVTTGNSSPSGEMECVTDPRSLIFKVYELSLCTAAATPSNQALGAANPCTKLYYDVNGEDIDLTAGGASIPLGSDVSLAEGTYTHALLKLGTIFKMATSIQFQNPQTSTDNSSGEFCYSKGVNTNFMPAANDSHFSCASAFPASVSANDELINFFGQDNSPDGDAWTNSDVAEDGYYQNTEMDVLTVLGGVTSTTDLYILDSNGVLATGDLDYIGGEPTLRGSSTRTYILANQDLVPNVEILPDTTNVEIGIKVSDSSGIGFNTSGEVEYGNFNGLIIQISAN